MTLKRLVSDHESRRVTVTAFTPAPIPELADHLEAPGVSVDWQRLPEDGSGGFVSVTADGAFLGSVPADAVRALVAPTDDPRPGTSQVEGSGLRAVTELLRDATFSSFDRRQLLAASREFEDRAVRTASGSLHAGFQRPDALAAQADLYVDIADVPGLDVHVYVDADWEFPGVPGTTLHQAVDTELGDVWFVVFDGGDQRSQTCGLFAVERAPSEYYGFWTYDESVVDDAVSYLTETFG